MLIFMRSISIFYAIVAPLIFTWLVHLYLKEKAILRRLEKAGQVTIADIIDSGKRSTARSHYYYLVYRFYVVETGVGNIAYTREQTISKKHFEKLQHRATIAYLPTAPNISRLTRNDIDNTTQKSVMLIVFVITIMWLLNLLLIYIQK